MEIIIKEEFVEDAISNHPNEEFDDKLSVKEEFCTNDHTLWEVGSITIVKHEVEDIYGKSPKIEITDTPEVPEQSTSEAHDVILSNFSYNTRKCSLNRHITSVHKDVNSIKCIKCDYASNGKEALARHTLDHNYGTSHRKDVKKRLGTRNKPKQFKCDLCNHICVQKAAFKKHVLAHSDENAIQCGINNCKFVSTYRGSFKKHNAIAHYY